MKRFLDLVFWSFFGVIVAGAAVVIGHLQVIP
jgi:hypothetical protein